MTLCSSETLLPSAASDVNFAFEDIASGTRSPEDISVCWLVFYLLTLTL